MRYPYGRWGVAGMRVLVLGHTIMDRSRKRAETSRTDSKAFFRQWTGKPAGLWRESKGGGECGPKPRPCSGPGIALGAQQHGDSAWSSSPVLWVS